MLDAPSRYGLLVLYMEAGYLTSCKLLSTVNITVDFSSLRICVTMSVRACVSAWCVPCVRGANHIVYYQ